MYMIIMLLTTLMIQDFLPHIYMNTLKLVMVKLWGYTLQMRDAVLLEMHIRIYSSMLKKTKLTQTNVTAKIYLFTDMLT